MTTQTQVFSRNYQWLVLGLFSLLYFLITAATFTSLGVVLPSMIQELGWSWSSAGLGFTLLGLACGLSSYLPAILIRKIGIRATLFVGAVVLSASFLTLYNTQSVMSYFIGTTLLGIGFSFVATVPGTYVLGRLYQKQSLAFGIYFTVGGLGGVIGPWIYFLAVDVFGSWRMHWGISGIALVIASVLTIILLREGKEEKDHADFVTQNLLEEENTSIYRTAQTWTAKQALKTWQFYVIAAAYTSFLLCGITVNSFSVAHVTDLGFSTEIAATLLSTQAFINAFSRVGSGIIGEWIEPKKLLIVSLTLMIIGLLSLSFANSWIMLVIFTIGIGVGYGMTFLASSVLLSNYYGRGPYLELFSVMNLISTVACFSPFFAGAVKDSAGSFAPAFLAISVIPVLVLIATLAMRPPQLADDDKKIAQAYS